MGEDKAKDLEARLQRLSQGMQAAEPSFPGVPAEAEALAHIEQLEGDLEEVISALRLELESNSEASANIEGRLENLMVKAIRGPDSGKDAVMDTLWEDVPAAQNLGIAFGG